MPLDEKAARLSSILQSYSRVALAFSGGVDSSVLLKCALTSLGAGNVLVLFGRSELLKPAEITRVENWPATNGYTQGIDLETIAIQPLSWKEFVTNDPERCYFCKLRLYSLFQERMRKRGYPILVDGTNIDDLKSKRAGLRAIHELGVKMPLVEAGLDKTDIRHLAKRLGLPQWDQPSASCLATRIPTGLAVTPERLLRIAEWENWLEQCGFSGCRVRLDEKSEDIAYLEIQSYDFEKLASQSNRLTLLRYFKNKGVKKIFLDLESR